MATPQRSDSSNQSVGEVGIGYWDSAAGTYVPIDQTHPMPVTTAGAGAAAAALADATANPTTGNQFALAGIYNGATWDRWRTPNVFKTAVATASGSTALWTPTAGKKFRLMRYCVQLTAEAALAAGADLTIALLDAAASIGQSHSVFVPTTSVTTAMGSWTTGWVDLGNGALSATINNVLNINLTAALTAGTVRVLTAGTEE